MTFYRPPQIELIRNGIRDASQKETEKAVLRSKILLNPNKDLFHIKPADTFLKEEFSKPNARQLLGSLWHEHELCILFADTNLGKSVLAVQIGYHIAKAAGMEPFGCQLNDPVKVLYFDFELTSAQFKSRYTDRIAGAHHFGESFIRAEFNPRGDDPLLYDKYEEYVQSCIESAIRQTNAAVVIIDNITCMGSTTHHSGGALPLMKTLKALTARHKLSMLVLAHTPKRSMYTPITVNDLQGSKMLINFADSAFAIGQSQQDIGLRYIKQVKQRSSGSDYGPNHVCLFRIEKQSSFLGFKFLGFDNEQAHLQKAGTSISEEMQQRIVELNRQGLSHRQAADNLKISQSTLRRVLTRLKEQSEETG